MINQAKTIPHRWENKLDKVNWLHHKVPVFLRSHFTRMTQFFNLWERINNLTFISWTASSILWLRESCGDYWFEKQKLHNRFVRHFTAFRNIYVTSKSYSKMRLNFADLRLKAWKVNRITPSMHTCYQSTVKIKIRN